MNKIIFSIFILCLSTSCNSVLYKVYGLDLMESFDERKYNKTLDKNREALSKSSEISIVSSKEDFEKYHTIFADLTVKKLSQPVQILYFKNKKLVSYHLNCYAKGNWKGDLDWNYENRFNTYFPKTAYSIPNSLEADLDSLAHIYDLPKELDESTIVLFWSNMFKKHVLSGIKIVAKNIKEHGNVNIPKLVLINTDKFFIQERDI